MSTEVGKIHYTLDLDDSKFHKGTKDASQTFDKLKKSSMIAVTAIGTGIIALGKIALENASTFETMGVSLNSVFKGNKEEAKNAQATITEFAKKTPYQLKDVLGAFILLKNMGLDPSEEALTAYGNTASAMGKSLDQMVQAVADATVGEFERLKEFGIKSTSEGDNITFTFRGVSTTIKKEAGAIETYLQKIGTVDFARGMEAQSLTLQGRISTLKDDFSLAMVEFANKSGLMDFAKQAIERLISVVNELSPKLLSMIDYFKNNNDALVILASVILAVAVPAFVALGVSIWGALAPLIPLIAIGAVIGILINTLVEKFGGWGNVMDILKNKLNEVKNKLWELWNVVSPYVMPMLLFMKDVITKHLVPALQELWTKLSPILIPALKILAVILGGIILASIVVVVGAVMGLILIITGLVKIINILVDNAKRGFKMMEDAITGSLNRIKDNINKASEVMKKLNPLQRFSPSLLDNVKKGTGAIIKEYKGMYNDLNSMSLENRFNLASGTSDLLSTTQINTPQPVNVNMNVDNYYGDQVGLTNFAERVIKEIDTINLARNNKLL